MWASSRGSRRPQGRPEPHATSSSSTTAESLERYTEENVKELREENPREGMEGISPRYIQDKISNALVASTRDLRQPLHGPQRARGGPRPPLADHERGSAQALPRPARVVKEEYADIVKNEVQRAIAADEEQIQRLCANYIDNVKAYTQKERSQQVHRPGGRARRAAHAVHRGEDRRARERKDDFRREIMNYIGALAVEGKNFDYRMNPRSAARAGEEALRGPEGFDQAHQPGQLGRGPGDAGEDRRHQGAAHQELRLQRGVRDGRAELRGEHLRAGGREVQGN